MADDTQMAQDRSPTTAEVRDCVTGADWDTGYDPEPMSGDAFDRWLAAHDAEVAARTLRMAAKWAESHHDIGWEGHRLMTPRYPDNGRQIAEALRASADELGQP